MERAPATVVQITRLVAALTLAVTLLALPAFNPMDASAMRRSERTVSQRCSAAGGSVSYDWMDGNVSDSWSMTCSLPSGTQFTCYPASGPFGGMVNC